MVRHLAKTLEADCVYIGAFTGGQVEQVRVLAASVNGETDRSFDYAMAGSAAAGAVLGKRCVCRTGARKLFPEDTMLSKFQAEAFLGVPLMNSDRQSLGILMALYHRPVHNFQVQTAMLEIFAPRATAELSRLQAEDQLRESEERYRTFIASNPDGMWRVEFDPPVPTNLSVQEQAERIERDGYIAECNDAAAGFQGRSNGRSLIGCRLSDLVDVECELSTHKDILAVVESGCHLVNVEAHPLDKLGKRRYIVRSVWGIVENGSLRRIWGITRDITRLRNCELELEASEQRLAELLEAIQIVVVMLDLDGAITYCNECLLRLTGWNFADIEGKNWLDLMIPPAERETLRAAIESVNAGSSAPVQLESTLLGPGGRHWWIAWDFTVLRDAGGNPTSLVFAGRDTTGYKALEAQFRQSQKLESVGRLAGGVAHDFNNLLTVIIGYASALLANRAPDDASHVGLSEIKTVAQKGSELAHQLLTFSCRQTFRPTILNLNTLISEHQRMLRRLIGENVELVADLDAKVGSIRVDAGHMHQVLMNLGVNARDAMPRGGKLIISTSNIETDPSELARWAELPSGKYVLLTVADTGVGMSDDVRSHIFEPFFTTKAPGMGTGLGLSTVYGIVQESKGYIFVDTKPGQGTTISLFFPRVDVAADTPADNPSPRVTGGSESILLVEDHYDVRVLTAKVLRQLGYRVSEAEGGEHALELAQASRAHFDLILTDIVMPRMSGVELVRRLRSVRPGIKVLLMSGYAENNAEAAQDREADLASFIQKPFTPEALALKVREVLEKRDPACS
jgi:PAS domain S-box-containing protein